MASFDDLGKVAKSAYVLEAGSYVFYVGNNVRDAKKLDFTYDLAEAKVTAQYTSPVSYTHLRSNPRGLSIHRELP